MCPNKQVEQQKVDELRKMTGVKDNLHLKAALRENSWDLNKAKASLGCSRQSNTSQSPTFSVRSSESMDGYLKKMRMLHAKRLTIWQEKGPFGVKEMGQIDQQMVRNARQWNKVRNPLNRYILHYLTTAQAIAYVEELVEQVRSEGRFSVLELVTGAGNRSTYREAPLKNDIVQAMQKKDINVYESPENRGLIIVELY